jgi:hypothetical protein
LIVYIDPRQWGHVAEWLRAGLQNRLFGFDSRRGLHLKPIEIAEICLTGWFAGGVRMFLGTGALPSERGHPDNRDQHRSGVATASLSCRSFLRCNHLIASLHKRKLDRPAVAALF